MEVEIIFTRNYLRRINSLIIYLQVRWNEKVVDEFKEVVLKKLILIKENPLIGSYTSDPKVRHILVTKHNLLYYQIKADNKILFLDLFDTRQNPSKNKYK